MTKWQSSVKREIYSGEKKKKVGSDFEWRVYGDYAVSNAKMDTTKFTVYFADKAIILLILTKGPKF